VYVFYDFETTGTSPAFDQPLQFAAIRTDDDLNPVDEVNIRCRLSPHILPAPWAMAVTGVTPSMLTDQSLPSLYEFSLELRNRIDAWSPAVFAGYNSISFDENFIRHTLYQNLHPDIYLTQFNGNTRFDLMLAVYACWVLAPDALEWPQDGLGSVIFKLDALAPANGFTGHDAHDALGDVRATIFLARLIRDRAPHVWKQMLANTNKNSVLDLIRSGDPVRLIARFGKPPPRSYVVAFCGTNSNNRNEVGLFDIQQHDPHEFVDADDDVLDFAVSTSPKVIRATGINKNPMIFPWTPRDGEDATSILGRADMIRGNDEFFGRIGDALAGRFPEREPSEQVEDQIFDGFYTATDKRHLQVFHQAEWQDRPTILAQISDERLRRLGMRLMFFERPDLVGEQYRRNATKAIVDRWNSNEAAGWTTFHQVAEELEEIEKAGAMTMVELAKLRTFYQERHSG